MGTFVAGMVSFYIEECIECGIQFAITERYQQLRSGDHKLFYCPNRHGQFYPGKSDEEKLKEQLRREKLERESAEASKDLAWVRADKAIRSQRASKGHLTRIKNRISEGVCPCCNRQFPNLQSHMKIKHPKYAEKEATK